MVKHSEPQEGSLGKKTLSGFLLMFASSSSQVLLRVIFMAILSRLLAPDDFGIVAIATMLTGFAELFVQMGVGPALVQLKALNDRHVSTAFVFSVLNGFFVGGLFRLFAPAIAAFFEMPGLVEVLYVLAWAFPIRSISNVSYNLLQRELKFKKLAGNEVVSYIVGTGLVGLPLALNGVGYMALVWANIVQALIYSAILFYHQPHKIHLNLYVKELRELLSFGAFFSISSAFGYLAGQGDYFVVGKMMGAAELGYYNRSYKLMNMSNTMVGSVMNKVLFPGFSKLKGERDKAGLALRRSYALVFMVFIPASVLSYVLAPELVAILLGSKWISVIPVFQILTFGMMFGIASKIGSSYARGTGMVKNNAVIHFIYFANVVVAAFFGTQWGLATVATFVTLAAFINFLLLAGIAIKHSSYSWHSLSSDLWRHILLNSPLAVGLYFFAAALRNLELHFIFVLLLTIFVFFLWLILLLILRPQWMMGTNSEWLSSTFEPKLRRLRLKVGI